MRTISLRLAHSPDSDDMVMWWPLTGRRGRDGSALPGCSGEPEIDTGPFRFSTRAEDVEALNRSAVARDGAFDVSAISAGAYPRVADEWLITSSGASFGEGYGPRLVAREDRPHPASDDLAVFLPLSRPGERRARLAIPGRHTTAYLTLRLAMRDAALREARDEAGGADEPEAVEVPFAEIPGLVARGEVDAGLLIHEAQLTFGAHRLRPLIDLGRWWSARTGLPLPLGLNVIRRDLDPRFGGGTCEELARVLASSVSHARRHPAESRQYLRAHAGERTEWFDDALVERYLSMYVSDLTEDMGLRGRAALAELFRRGHEAALIPACEPAVAPRLVRGAAAGR